MNERMFGLETEYAIAGIKGNGHFSRDILMSRFMQAAKKCLVHLPDIQNGGMFLTNGSRLYIDCGQHPELATPECTNPWDAVRYLKAGEMIMDAVIKQLRSDIESGGEIFCSLCNVDYIENTTWGCHESYLHRCDSRILSRHIIPHLVTRTIFTGAGGFEPSSAGFLFTLSPRASHISHEVSNESTGDRGIYHTKDESLSASGYHRLHILCGESLRSEIGIWLKIGTTAIIVAMIEAGLKPCEGLQLESPVKALRTVAADTHCKKKLILVGGRSAGAIDIQRRYLNLAERHQHDSFMPSWTESACSKWRQILDLLEEDPEKTHKMLDWTIKKALYNHHLENRGMQWKRIQAWNRVVGLLQGALKESKRHYLLRPNIILGPNSPVLETVALLTPFIRKNGLRWDELESFLHLKQEMFEIDMRFGQIGEKGVFQSLGRTGMLEQHIEGVDSIEQAMSHPPSTGRARVRGEMVRRLADQGSKYKCGWQVICDQEKRPVLDLSDPFFAGEDAMLVKGSSACNDNQRELPFVNNNSDADPLLRPFLRARDRSL